MLFPKAMDANEYALKVQPADKSFGLVLRHAQWLGEGAALADRRAPWQGVRYIEVTLEDIAVAIRLAHEVLGRSLDELPPQTRRLLLLWMGG